MSRSNLSFMFSFFMTLPVWFLPKTSLEQMGSFLGGFWFVAIIATAATGFAFWMIDGK